MTYRAERGASGRTHCGRWTSDVPEGVGTTRLVCNQKANHRGRHLSGWSGYEWFDGETPRRRSPSSP